MSIVAWMKEVRRLIGALHDEHDNPGAWWHTTPIGVTHEPASPRRAGTAIAPVVGPFIWKASASGVTAQSADSPEAAMRALVTELRGKLDDKIRVERARLERLQKAQAATLRVVPTKGNEE